MEIPAGTLDRVTKRKQGAPRTERQELIDKFLVRLNAARKGTKYGELTHSALATILTKVPTSDLYSFYRQCEEAKSFGALFWFKLKGKPKEV